MAEAIQNKLYKMKNSYGSGDIYDFFPDFKATGSNYAASLYDEATPEQFMASYNEAKGTAREGNFTGDKYKSLFDGTYNPNNTQWAKDPTTGALTTTGALAEQTKNATDPNMQAVKVGGGTAYIPKTGAGGQPTAAMQNMPNIGTNNTSLASNTQAQNPFQQALAQTKASGTPAPATMGGAKSTIQGTVQPEAPDMSIVDSMLQQDKGFQDLQKTYSEYFHPETQKKTLMDTYDKLYKDAGLDNLDHEILDAKTIIEGTEDDIRNEIQQAGGFGTDSQVQALSLSRNKVLLKNYNNLVAMREQKANNLNTMMSLAEKDRAYADQQVDRMFNFDMQMQDYRNKFVQNTLDQYNKYEPAQLYAMLKDNPQQLAFAEQIMGVGQGGLEKLASTKGKSDLMEVSPGATLYDKTTGKAVYTAPQKTPTGTGTGGGTGVSSTTQAIINNPSLFDDLTPTKKGEVISELQAQGYDTSNLGLKGMSDAAIQNVAQTQKALDDLAVLKTKIQDNEDKLGPIKGLARLNPWSESRKIQADVDRVRQTVGKALEGGVLRKEDEEKYKKILATLTDTPSTAYYKIDALIGSITRDIATYKSLQQSAGRSMNTSASLQKQGSATKVEDLRAKYQY